MFKLLKNITCYTPEYLGIKDILIVYDKIHKISDNIDEKYFPETEVIDCTGKIAVPGLIDQHVHITGGGGEEGPGSRIPEINLGDIVSSGVTTVIGLLGIDSVTRNTQSLLAKARALEGEGLTTYIYAGSYNIPTSTLTGKPVTDIALIDKVIGIGEVAISDYRSTHPTLQQLKELAWEARAGALIGKKAGVVHIHIGDGKKGIEPVIDLVKDSDFPISMFVPTHVNRNRKLFEQAAEYCKNGGNIDLTAGEKSGPGYSVPEALEFLYTKGIDMSRVTISSDGNGSIPSTDGGNTGIGRVMELFNDVISSIKAGRIPVDIILGTVTKNVADVLGLTPKKGCLKDGSDADITILNSIDMKLDMVYAKGELFYENGKVIKKGRYEK